MAEAVCLRQYLPRSTSCYCVYNGTMKEAEVAKVKLTCAACGKVFERFPSDVKNNKNNFCSRACRTDFYKKGHVERTCKQCGKKFSVYRSALEKSNASGNFCCRKCYNEYQKTLVGPKNVSYRRIATKCYTCGKPIAVTPSKMKEYEHHFCSVACRSKFMEQRMSGENNPLWAGGSENYRGDFARVKREHFAGVQFCAICGTTENIHIHHIIPYRMTQDNSIVNLIPLCNKHHKQVEHVSLKLIETIADYEKARLYLNLILRERQFEAHGALIGLLRERGMLDVR